MTMTNDPSYPRAPSERLMQLLHPGGFLAPLVDRSVLGLGGRQHDVQFLINDCVGVYAGSARLLTAEVKSGGDIVLKADEKYKKYSPDLFRYWKLDEVGFAERLNDYLKNVEVDGWDEKESGVQARWARVSEHRSDPWYYRPWIPFSREAALEYQSKEARGTARKSSEVVRAYELVKNLAERNGWAMPKLRGPGPNIVDQIAVDPIGKLVLIELKYAGATKDDSIYFAPLQLLEYAHEWDNALRAARVRDQLRDLIRTRKELGLMSDKVPDLTGGIRLTICFGDYRHAGDSPQWPTTRLKSYYYEVVDLICEHLPNGVRPIETWKLDDEGPRQIVRSSKSPKSQVA